MTVNFTHFLTKRPILNKGSVCCDIKHECKGGALVYILIAIALLAALTASFIEPASQQSRAQNAFRLATSIDSQVQFIRAALQDCLLLYPAGGSAVGGTDPGYHAPYPVHTDSDYFIGSTLGKAADRNVEFLRCPGNPGGSNDHTPMFSGSSGRFMPPPPNLFNAWTYYNGAGTVLGETVDGVYVQLASDKSDPFIGESLTKVTSKYASCEADYIVGTGSNGCANGEQCFRIWLRRDSAC